ncbi:hypothetical protein MY04_4665 [Flammeovirga sp. MY04]|uniref:hypothetical protein n=1 Tax=Flammeovirga sp. MY04 TaxID=1191459 RepID=UPI0008249AAC|nr:hypothetical protein [Flammeovirga sp. MY04]ANQ52000.2 hypothetical protein MY04_4665 [Flammeovirga sp. MY04]
MKTLSSKRMSLGRPIFFILFLLSNYYAYQFYFMGKGHPLVSYFIPISLFLISLLLLGILLKVNNVSTDGKNVIISNPLFGKTIEVPIDNVDTLASQRTQFALNDPYELAQLVNLCYTDEHGEKKSAWSLDKSGYSKDNDMIFRISQLKKGVGFEEENPNAYLG